MKKLETFLCLAVCALAAMTYSGCTKEEVKDDGDMDGTPNKEEIRAVGFQTERPVKRIVYYDAHSNEKTHAMLFTWQGNHITSLSMAAVNEAGGYEDMVKHVYEYKDDQIVYTMYERDENGEMKKSDRAGGIVLLDAEGYADTYIDKKTMQMTYVNEMKEQREVTECCVYEFQAVRDNQHRLTKYNTKNYMEYPNAEDRAWMEKYQGYVPDKVEKSEMTMFGYDERGNQTYGGSMQYTDLVNKNGFYVFMHSYWGDRNLLDLPMGPYDIFNVHPTPNLPSRFDHEIYDYEVDKDGYVTKIYDQRDFSGTPETFKYGVVEY